MGIGSSKAIEQIEQSQPTTTPGKYQEFLGLQTAIHAEGEDAQVIIRTTEGSIKLMMSFEHMGRANTEIRRAALIMLHRQSMKKDAGQAKYTELLKTALEPDRISVVVDPHTADRVFMLEFYGHSPIPIRLSPEMHRKTVVEVAAKTKATAN